MQGNEYHDIKWHFTDKANDGVRAITIPKKAFQEKERNQKEVVKL